MLRQSGSIAYCSEPCFPESAKHIEADCHFILDELVKGVIRTIFAPTHEQLAYIFTKVLGKSQFEYLFRKLGIRDRHAPT